jgi:hypothetical protein
MRLAEEVSSGAACAPVNTMAQTATIISATEALEGEYATVLALVCFQTVHVRLTFGCRGHAKACSGQPPTRKSPHMLKNALCLAVGLGVTVGASSLNGQTPDEVREFHESATSLIRQMSSRALTPGDTFFTWNPRPGGLIHTVASDPTGTRSSLLRGDGMIGTANIHWLGSHPSEFDVEWTKRDSITGKPLKDIESHGHVVGDTLYVAGTKPLHTPLPKGFWAVADFGMEEALIPLLPPTGASQRVTVFRPWHGRWDTVTIAIHDTAGFRLVDLWSDQKTHELMVVTGRGELLWIVRFDQPGERRPLEGSSRYQEYLSNRSLLIDIAKQYARNQRPDP